MYFESPITTFRSHRVSWRVSFFFTWCKVISVFEVILWHQIKKCLTCQPKHAQQPHSPTLIRTPCCSRWSLGLELTVWEVQRAEPSHFHSLKEFAFRANKKNLSSAPSWDGLVSQTFLTYVYIFLKLQLNVLFELLFKLFFISHTVAAVW